MHMKAILIASLALGLAAAPALAGDAPRLQPSADGHELIDATARLAWSRCVEGMQWNGTYCSGDPRLATHAQALSLARARTSADGRLWRVPRALELKRLSERLVPARHAAALLPTAPTGPYWTSTVRIESEAINLNSYRSVERGATERQVHRLSVQQGWAVEQPGGEALGMAKREKLPVRLVRALEP
jgi:hypothetical protein